MKAADKTGASPRSDDVGIARGAGRSGIAARFA